MLPETSEETSVVGMMPSRKSVVEVASPVTSYSADPMSRPSPGCRMLPTTRPIARAKVDMSMK